MSNESIWSSPKIPFYTMAMLTTALVIYHLIAICYYSRRLPGTTTTTTTATTTTTTGAAGDAPSSTMVANTPVVRMIDNSIPAHKYRKGGISGNLVGEDGVCAVCLGEFEDGEELRTLPECLHSFHVSCIDVWLFSHPNCPICRADTFPS